MSEMRRILVADGHSEGREALMDALSRLGFATLGAGDGNAALASIHADGPDAALLSLALPHRDGYAVLEALGGAFMPHYPMIVVTTAMGDAPKRRAEALGADAVMDKPVDPAACAALLDALFQNGLSKIAQRHAETRRRAAQAQLLEIGMPETLKGFGYLLEAVALASVDDRMPKQATSRLYPWIAQTHGVSDHSVERAIRHAIEATWTRGNVDALHRVFGNSIDPQRGKPTNIECVTTLALRLRERRSDAERAQYA